MKFFAFVSVIGLVFWSEGAAAATYNVDKAHSNVNFEIDHLVISTVEGSFREFKGSFQIDPVKKALTKVEGVIQADSIDTNEKDRDKHLRSADFFDVKKFPTLSFTSSEFMAPMGKKDVKMPGKLTIHGVPVDVIWKVTFKGMVVDPWGNQKAALDAHTEINRKDFGLTWNKALETGGLVVGETVRIDLHVEGNLAEEVKDSKKEAKK